jgi:serine/threonine protein kinase
MALWLPDSTLEHVRQVADEPDLSGTKYRLLGLLGRGGMGSVYAARDLGLDREVAIKVSSEPLREEARVLAQLEHPSIVPVHDEGVLPDGRRYYVMKRVRGTRLDAWARGEVTLRDRLRLFERICEAIAFAHARGVLHRDLKPQNIMVGEFGEGLVMDWGLARRIESPAVPGKAVAGTPGYMAPEQARGDGAATDARTDVYGLGAVLHSLVGAGAPKPVAALCAKAMAEEPAARYASALELAHDVRRFLDGERVHAYQESLPERVARFATRNRVVLSLIAAYVLVRLLLIALAR